MKVHGGASACTILLDSRRWYIGYRCRVFHADKRKMLKTPSRFDDDAWWFTGTVITTLWMEGPQRVQYSILADEATERSIGNTKGSQESSGPFAVTSSGQVEVRRGLDHERRRTHRITVTNHTMSTPPALDYMTISVVVSPYSLTHVIITYEERALE